jgi:uncharacterized membrane protein
MTDLQKLIVSVLGLCLLLGGSAAFNYFVWKECRTESSAMYCLKLVMK